MTDKMTEYQHVIPEATAGVTSYEFVDWATAETAQRALLEIDRSVAAAEILFGQMARKKREIGRSMSDLSEGIAHAANKYGMMARDLGKMAAE